MANHTNQFPKLDHVFEQQGRKTFFKVKPDWLQFGKIHLSFVSHEEGQSKQAIECGLDTRDAGYLLEAIRRGDLVRARANPSTTPLFQYMGGTARSRSRSGTAISKILTIQAGSKVDYLVSVTECEGVESSIGGISPKPGAPVVRIAVGMSEKDLLSMANNLDRLLQTWQMHQLLSRMDPFSMWDNETRSINAPEPSPARDTPVWVILDSWLDNCEVFLSAELCLTKVQSIVRELHRTMSLDNRSYEAAAAALQNGLDEIPPIFMTAKDGSDSISIFVKKTVPSR